MTLAVQPQQGTPFGAHRLRSAGKALAWWEGVRGHPRPPCPNGGREDQKLQLRAFATMKSRKAFSFAAFFISSG